MNPKKSSKSLAVSILSLSLLTVMAGAAVAPALGTIQEYFSNQNPLLVQMIISIPSLFIILTSFIFPRLCRKFGARTLVLSGLVLYSVSGCAAGLFRHIAAILFTRALVGIGVGILMPLSTGLLTYYFAPEKLDRLMGYSSAMNQLGGAAATLLSGLLASISWRLSFLVYAFGVPSIFLILLFLPNDSIGTASAGRKPQDARDTGNSVWKKHAFHFLAIFFLMVSFFLYPANFSIISSARAAISQGLVAGIMAGTDIVAFFGGLSFVFWKRLFGDRTRFFAPVCFFFGYVLLLAGTHFALVLGGSALIGFANGLRIPYILSDASQKAGKGAAASVLPLLSASLYLGQFCAPLLTSFAASVLHAGLLLPYGLAAVSSVLFFLASIPLRERTCPAQLD